MRETEHRGWAKSATVAKNKSVCRLCMCVYCVCNVESNQSQSTLLF